MTPAVPLVMSPTEDLGGDFDLAGAAERAAKGQPTISDRFTALKCSDDEGSEGIPKFTGKSPSRKAHRLPCINLKRGSCQKVNSCNYWHGAKKSKLQPVASSDTSHS